MSKNRKGYYVIITDEVLFNHRLSASSKIFFGEVLTLSSGKSGYCFASNKYFREKYNCSVSTIQNWIKELKNEKLIATKLIRHPNGKTERRIKIIRGGLPKKHQVPPPRSWENNNTRSKKQGGNNNLPKNDPKDDRLTDI
ncbi:helix-turn-helix domain-containing protein [Weeksellaceae bacterium KMM 9713]|uniref:Helix-turn-helix domain-containing protein n=1 Tax=Profundicola chukchiensis TaxID=2961959 RepID=A0A9X4N1X8_9FLAO|nr:helix-turn-helix domain-containing protein [Profundicola chukchiensis]MDG4945114.1 helix-turn-helix domain-containing protein [Profundicola chukchiensis]